MKSIVAMPIVAVVLASSALAQNMVYRNSMMGGGLIGLLLGLLYFAVACFIFGMIFWWTHKIVFKDMMMKMMAGKKGK